MRSFIVMGMFAASLANAEWQEHLEIRELQLSAEGIAAFDVESGSGSVVIRGMPNTDAIRVKAMIRVQAADEKAARKLIASDMKLSLIKLRDHGKLEATFDNNFWGRKSTGSIDLEIEMPASLVLDVNDGAGLIDISDVEANIRIDDGSGSISVRNVGNIKIDDGSGSIDVTSADGDVFIDDGSGRIKVGKVGGSVTIDDGSGGINVSDVEHDLIIVDDGSGGLSVSDVRGNVKKNRSRT